MAPTLPVAHAAQAAKKTRSSKKKASSPQRHGAAKLLKSAPAAGSNEIVTKPGLKPLALVQAAKNGVSVLDWQSNGSRRGTISVSTTG
ncbi:hypothetical protein V500_01533 [Pseudogymnoascus sp. VKM F-4518 (FW-2643)]|nr:hypothetical protein V500_01533 [Pseudogymnoascus sp. VKM F-4518 (FW-2643)]